MKQEVKFKHILIGLKNSPSLNNCFLNSILQCLLHTKELTSYFLNDEYISEVNTKNKLRGALAKTYARLIKAASNSQDFTIIDPKEIKILVGHFAPQFMSREQQDCQEFLRFFLDALHDDLNRIKVKPAYQLIESTSIDLTKTAHKWIQYSMERDDSIICDIFRGQLQSNIKCKGCQKEINNFETFLDLSLPIPKQSQIGIYDCFNEFTKEETIQYKCEQCQKINKSVKQLKIWSWPKVLVIHLKRFSNIQGKRYKLNKQVNFTENLELAKFQSQQAQSKTLILDQNTQYSLYAISHHQGGLESGHYITEAKVNQDWFQFDDMEINLIGPNFKNTAYVLFYRKLQMCDQIF